MYRIYTGDKAYSSWSMRGWLLLAAFDLPFEERPVPMYDPAFDAYQRAKAPARTVPMVEWDEGGRQCTVWDTLAIAETLNERHPAVGIWPADPRHRLVARALAAEMHSGFAALRASCPMNVHRVPAPHPALPEAVVADAARVAQLWAWALTSTGGPWLGGPAFSAADAFYAPVALRFEEYDLSAEGVAHYLRELLAHPAVVRWVEAAKADPRRITHYEVG